MKTELKRTDGGWFVRQSYYIKGSSVQRTSYYQRFGTALVNYVKLVLERKTK